VAAQPSDVLDELDRERPDEPYVVGFAGRTVVFRPAAGPSWRVLLDALSWPPVFLATFGPDDPGDVAAVESLPVWQMRAVMAGWRTHHGLCADDAANLRLASMLSKREYRAAAERDLWEVHHLDLTVEWRSRRWRRLLNLLDGLRRTSHTHDAMMQDEQLAEVFLERERRGEESAKKSSRRMTEFTLEAELLSYAVDRLGELIVAQAAGKGAKPRRVEPMPRPDTAMQRVRERKTRSRHDFTVARVFGFIDEKGRPTGRGPADKKPSGQ
jgi:hypothetical protein